MGKTLPDFKSPFLLAGHSLGGSTILNYAINHPQLVEGLILVSSVFSGKDLLEHTQNMTPEFYHALATKGVTRSQEGRECFLDLTYLQELQKYDFYSLVSSFQKPILLITGDKDTASLPQDNKNFYEHITAPKILSILQDCTHIYEKEKNQQELDKQIRSFIKKLNNYD